MGRATSSGRPVEDRPQDPRGRLTIWYCAVLTVILAVFGVSLYLLVRVQLLQHYDQELKETATGVEEVLSRREDCEHLSSDQLADLNQFARLILFHAVGGDRKIFYRSPDLASLRVARDLAEEPDFLKREASFQTYQGPRVSFRVYTVPYRSRAGRQGLIRVIESLGDVENSLARLRLALLLVTPLPCSRPRPSGIGSRAGRSRPSTRSPGSLAKSRRVSSVAGCPRPRSGTRSGASSRRSTR